MSKVTVHSTICDFEHHITGKKEGKHIIIDIVSPCEKIQKLAHLEVPIKEIFDIKDNYVLTKAQEAQCSSNCLVPCGIIHVCRREAGFLAKSLFEKVGRVSISFEAY